LFWKKAGNIHAAVDTVRAEEPRNFSGDPAARKNINSHYSQSIIYLYAAALENFTLAARTLRARA
jgi:hypothetical protein